MKLKQIRLDQITIPAVRVTALYAEEHLKLLKDSLAAMGTVQPIIVCADSEGYALVDGLHRLQEARERGEKVISAVIYEGGPQETLLMNLVLNRVRGRVKASEMVGVIKELWQTHGLDSDMIAAKTGLTRDYIEKLQVISGAALSVQEALDKEIIGVGHAFEIARLPTQIQQDELMAKTQIWRYTVKELHDFVDNVLREMEALKVQPAGAKGEVPVAPPKYYCEGCKAEVPQRYLRPVLICPDCFGRLWRLVKEGVTQVIPPQENNLPG